MCQIIPYRKINILQKNKRTVGIIDSKKVIVPNINEKIDPLLSLISSEWLIELFLISS
jgi:hypothetical protein